MSIERSIVFNFHKLPVAPEQPRGHEEGDTCAACDKGVLRWHSENCSCHVRAPCGSCETAPLKCDECNEEIHP